MSRYEITNIKHKKDNYEFNIIDLNDKQTYVAFFLKVKKTIDRINDIKNTQNNIKIVSDVLISSKYEEIIVNKIPEQIQNEELYITLIKTDGYLIRYFDESDITYNMCLEAIKEQPFAIRHIPKKFITDELIDTAISLNGVAIMYIEKEKRTDERCFNAYNSNPRALRFVPPYLVTYDLCIDAVSKDMFCLQYVPDIYLLQVYKEAVLDKGLQIPKRNMPGVTITLAGQFKDIRKRIDFLSNNTNKPEEINNNNEPIFENDEDKYNWLLNKREQLLQELNFVESELYNLEETREAKHK